MKDKPDKPLVEKLMEENGLNQKQAKFTLECAKGASQREAYTNAGYKAVGTNIDTSASHLASNNNVKQAHMSLLHELYPQQIEDFRLSKEKVLLDLEGIKVLAVQNIREGKAAGGAYNAVVRSSELQGRELGMFSQRRHHHEHEHSIVPDKMLLDRLAKSNPSLAQNLAEHMGVGMDGEVIEGDFTED